MWNFNLVDVLLVLLVLFGAIFGWQRGFILTLLDLARWTTSFLAAFYFYQPLADQLNRLNDWTEIWNQPLAFILIIFLASSTVHLLGAWLLRKLPRDVHKRAVNRLFRILPGAMNGVVTAAIAATVLLAVPFSDYLYELTRESSLANRFAGSTEAIENALLPIFNPAIQQTLTRRVPADPESTTRAELPFKVENPRPRPDLEARMLELVNNERRAAGLSPLAADPELLEVARRHSVDMFARGYFAHYTPENKSPFDRIREANVRFITAGENLALAPTLQIAHTGLMNSPGHRANILRLAFGRVGIGVMDGGRRGLMITQNFRN